MTISTNIHFLRPVFPVQGYIPSPCGLDLSFSRWWRCYKSHRSFPVYQKRSDAPILGQKSATKVSKSCAIIPYVPGVKPLGWPLISALSFIHILITFWHDEPCSIWPCSPWVSYSSVVRASHWYLEGHGFDSRWGLRKFFFWVFQLENTSPLFTLYQSHQSIYHLILFTFVTLTCWALQ